MSEHPRFGHTRDGLPVHARTIDHHKGGSAYARFNKALAVKITNGVGSMTCAWVFCVVALIGLPQAWQQAFAGGHFSPLPLVQWVAQTFLQLVLLSVILVGQNVSAGASDARAARTFEDAETIMAEVKDIKQAVGGLDGNVTSLANAVQVVMAARAAKDGTPTPPDGTPATPAHKTAPRKK